MANHDTIRTDSNPPRPHKSRRPLLFLAVAVVMALSTALVINSYVNARTAAMRVPTVKVVVATVDVPIAATLRPNVLATVDWPAATKPEGAFGDPKQLVGQVVSQAVVKGEPILPGKIASSDGGRGLAGVLPPGMRAVSVKVDDVVGVAGFILPGNHVDVIATMRSHDLGSGAAPSASKIVLQNLKVLAMGKEIDQTARDPAKAPKVTVATLMVDSDQAERLALVAARGQILLALRSGLDDAEVDTRGVVPAMIFSPTAAGPTVATAEPAKGKAPAAVRHGSRRQPQLAAQNVPPSGPSVEIIRGDLFEKRNFKSAGGDQ